MGHGGSAGGRAGGAGGAALAAPPGFYTKPLVVTMDLNRKYPGSLKADYATPASIKPSLSVGVPNILMIPISFLRE